jgi:hypothetical protein
MSSSPDVTSLPQEVIRPLSQSVIHITKLPTLAVVLDYALIHVATNSISPWMNPSEWVRTDSAYVQDIVSGLAMLVVNDSDEDEIVQCMIYPVYNLLVRSRL